MPDQSGNFSAAKARVSRPATAARMPRRPADAPAAIARPDIGPLRVRHLALGERMVETGDGVQRVTVDEAESPLGWLARRRGRDGRALIAPHQLQAGERLRADFTRGQLMPRTTADWSRGVASERRGSANGSSDITDAALAARQHVNAALEAVGPELSGLLLDLCCFLKGLEDIERARAWPPRSAKVVLQLALDRLARHYGYLAESRGKPHPRLRTWLAEGASFRVD